MGLGSAPLNTEYVRGLERATGRTKRPKAIYCDDCGREKMAEIRDGKLVITDRRHGRLHVAVVDVSRMDERSAKLD